ncbi:MAG: hypothetical protein J1F23_00970 [Oscillospiraceae bacterium]|nr:hypothetical protein [Oscillospiraceae bacterium]
MSKTKKLKQKTTGFDILYRVVAAAMAAAMFPLVYFMNLIYFEIDHSNISGILSLLTGEADLGITYDYISLAKLGDYVDMLKSFTGDDVSFNMSQLWSNAAYRPAIVAAAFLALALVIGLVIFCFALFSNRAKIVAVLSGAGLLFTGASYISFTNFFANRVVSGDISLAQLFNAEGSLMSLIIEFVADISVLRLDSAFFAVLFLMLGLLIWSVSVIVVNASDEKEKKLKAQKN